MEDAVALAGGLRSTRRSSRITPTGSKAATDGRVKITPMPVGSIVAYNETLDAVANGILEAQHGGTTYFSGRDAAFALIGDLSGGFETPWQMQMWYEYGGGLELTRELYKEYSLYFVGPVWWGVESIPSKVPINGPADLKGVKIRAPEGMGAADLQAVRRRRRDPGRQRSLHRPRARRDRRHRLGHDVDEHRPRLSEDRQVRALSRLPLDAGRRRGGQPRSLERPVGRPTRGSSRSATRDFARDMVERIALQGPAGRQEDARPGRHADRLVARGAQGVPPEGPAASGRTGRRSRRPGRQGLRKRSRASWKKLGLL